MRKRIHRGWHPEDIKAAIRKKGVNVSDLGKDHGLSGSAMRLALWQPVPRADKVIADFLEVPLHALWPDRYDAEGHKIYRKYRSRSQAKDTPPEDRPHRETTVAA